MSLTTREDRMSTLRRRCDDATSTLQLPRRPVGKWLQRRHHVDATSAHCLCAPAYSPHDTCQRWHASWDESDDAGRQDVDVASTLRRCNVDAAATEKACREVAATSTSRGRNVGTLSLRPGIFTP